MIRITLNSAESIDLRALFVSTSTMYIRHALGPSRVELHTSASDWTILPSGSIFKTDNPDVWARGWAPLELMTQPEYEAYLNAGIPDTGTGTVNAALPPPYNYKKSPISGRLQLYKADECIMEQDEYGAWVSTAISTGTGSVHFKDIHSLGSAGANLVTVNHADEVAYFPAWHGVSLNGATTIPLGARHPGALGTVEVGGPLNINDTPVEMTWVAPAPFDLALFSIEFMPAEDYSGIIQFRVGLDDDSQTELEEFYADVHLQAGVLHRLEMRYPLWATGGKMYRWHVVNQQTGAFLRVRPGDHGTPWRRTISRPYQTVEVNSGRYRGDLSTGSAGSEAPHCEKFLYPCIKGDWWRVVGSGVGVGEDSYADGVIFECHTSAVVMEYPDSFSNNFAIILPVAGGTGVIPGAKGDKGERGEKGEQGPPGLAAQNEHVPFFQDFLDHMPGDVVRVVGGRHLLYCWSPRTGQVGSRPDLMHFRPMVDPNAMQGIHGEFKGTLDTTFGRTYNVGDMVAALNRTDMYFECNAVCPSENANTSQRHNWKAWNMDGTPHGPVYVPDFKYIFGGHVPGTEEFTKNQMLSSKLGWIDIPEPSNGVVGKDGEQGIQGLPGAQGDRGLQGPQGDLGPTGPQGVAGKDGAQGERGTQGPVGLGTQGPQGDRGARGTRGTLWATGEGDPVNDGFRAQGDMYLDNLSGNIWYIDVSLVWQQTGNIKGKQGITGAKGATGDTGIQGPQGADGTAGGITTFRKTTMYDSQTTLYSSGTFPIDAATKYICVELQAQGGRSGCIPALTSSQSVITGGGGAGGYIKVWMTRAQWVAMGNGVYSTAGTIPDTLYPRQAPVPGITLGTGSDWQIIAYCGGNGQSSAQQGIGSISSSLSAQGGQGGQCVMPTAFTALIQAAGLPEPEFEDGDRLDATDAYVYGSFSLAMTSSGGASRGAGRKPQKQFLSQAFQVLNDPTPNTYRNYGMGAPGIASCLSGCAAQGRLPGKYAYVRITEY
jgi:hypothetical protein